MVNQSSSSSYPILCASFNQDNSCFAIATRDGIKIFDANSGRLCYERAIGAFVIVEMLYASSLLAIVGAGEQASLSPRRLCLFNITTGNALRDLNFLTSILAVRVNRKRLVVTLQEKTYIYDINSLDILDTIDTVPNFKGLCAFSPSLDGCFLALPASATKGSVLVYNVMEHHSHCESYSFRRGTYPSTIFSLSFGPSMQLPDILVATSSSGSVHAFPLGFALNQRSRRPSSFLGSIIPESVNDASAHHHVLHNASPARVKSYAVIRKVDKVAESSMSESAAYRATISLITYSGYFLEYSLSINHQNESSWILEREFNLLTVISECVNS
ncbi:autophagy-related protein 18b-like isoform X6 [Camellia sinensis]|uniref:autophagy-related protein 18b-like isoform X6 n=1 Tax=Camellia sinensis TaxID=4442 RepID=UPI001035E328|nr:autophagy-related protein 18b-like isoform X6 [Camellia sinensis]